MDAPARGRINAGIDKALPQRRRQMPQGSEIFVISVGFAGEHAMQRMVKIVAPLGIDSEAARFTARDNARIV